MVAPSFDYAQCRSMCGCICQGYMREMLLAMQDGCKVFGYTAWSLMDNFEWTLGYTMRFGLYHVDFDSADKTRTPKLSAHFITNVTRDRAVPP